MSGRSIRLAPLRPRSFAVLLRFCAISAAVGLGAAISPAAAQNPYDADQTRLGRLAERRGNEGGGMIPLLELWGQWDDATPSRTLRELERLGRSRRLSPLRRVYVQTLVAHGLRRVGRLDDADRVTAALGFVTDWQVVGPFDNEGKQGFRAVQPPEEEVARRGPFDPAASWRGKERQVGWRRFPQVSDFGYVSFDAVFRPWEHVCGYAVTTVHVERDRPLTLLVGAAGATKIYWNGEEVLVDDAYRAEPDADRSAVMVGARSGANRLMVKSCISESAWGFFLRIAEPDGSPARGVRIDAETIPALATEPRPTTLPAAPVTPLAALESAAAGDAPTPEALEELARFLRYTGADDPAERRAKQLANRAAEAGPTADRYRFAARFAEQRSDLMRLVAKAAELAPTDPEIVLLQARVRASGLMPEEALPILDSLRDNGMVAMEAEALRAGILGDLGFAETALGVYERLIRRATDSPGWTLALAEVAAEAGQRDRAMELRRRLVRMRFDDTRNRRVLLADALTRGETDEVVAQLEVLRRLDRGDVSNLRYVAAVYEGLGRDDDALAVYHDARELAPEDTSTLIAQGRFLLRLGQREGAAEALRAALTIRPQDAGTRELLEQIQPETRADERYAVASEELLARRGEANGYPITTLEDLTVNTVYENGLGSSFRQVAAQIHDQEGARRWRAYSIRFDPGSQRIDVRLARIYRRDGRVLEALRMYEESLGEPWYRIYYDTRALVVVFPDLEPGDTVELRWRIDDVAHRNVFADYYGDLSFLQSSDPIRRFDYVLITPKSRAFFFNQPRLASLRHERNEEGTTRVDHYVATDVPALRPEVRMPGMTEVAPYLHVSTYRAWADVGRWYWGLIQDQLRPDESLRRTVAGLVAGAPDLETKVRRIHAWVVDHTRYVGLEFGIHGFKPYRVAQIVERGFGDCKDKASLLYAMFREAGIDAHIVLVRTRRNGAIHDLPASLAVFDHAIAFVPALNLYIDGTAEHSGVTELPSQDQGVTVLHVWPEGAELRRTPVLAADRSVRERRLEIDLHEDGSGKVRVQENVRGSEAAGYRSHYQAEGTRSERLERALRGLFPGLRIESQTFESLDRDRPIRFRYEAEVPQVAQREAGGLRLAPSVLDELVPALARTPNRRLPVDLGAPSTYVEERVIRLPEGHRVTQAPNAGRAESPFGTVSLRVETQGQALHVRTELTIAADRVAPEDYAAFRRWVQQVDELLRQRITIQRAR